MSTAVHLEDLGTVLGVWAHPDDEAYRSAGLMAQARTAGHRVVVATATYGEPGTPDPDRWGPQRLAALRRYELAASLAVVGVHEHRWLGFRDGSCAAIPAATGAAAVAELRLEFAGPQRDRKLVALCAHASQTAALVQELGADEFGRWWSTEAFVAASPDSPSAAPELVAVGSGGTR